MDGTATDTIVADLEGTLADFPLAPLLRFVAASGRTGSLTVAYDPPVGLWFDAGALALAAPLDEPIVRDRLVDTGLIRHGGWERARDLAAAGHTGFVTALCEEGGADPQLLSEALYDLTVETCFELLLPSRAPFWFSAAASHPLMGGQRFDAAAVVADAEARLASWRKIAATVPSTTSVPRLATELPLGVNGVSITREEWAVLAAVDGEASVAAIISRTGLTAFGVCGVLDRLARAGAILIDGG
jgi:hypothetical protein